MNLLDLPRDCLYEIALRATDYAFLMLVSTCKKIPLNYKSRSLKEKYNIFIVKCYENRYIFTNCVYNQTSVLHDIFPKTIVKITLARETIWDSDAIMKLPDWIKSIKLDYYTDLNSWIKSGHPSPINKNQKWPLQLKELIINNESGFLINYEELPKTITKLTIKDNHAHNVIIDIPLLTEMTLNTDLLKKEFLCTNIKKLRLKSCYGNTDFSYPSSLETLIIDSYAVYGATHLLEECDFPEYIKNIYAENKKIR